MSPSTVSEHLGDVVLRPGADVHTTDSIAMDLADIVMDPISRTLTHVVVTPPRSHQQDRLVPLWLVNVSATQGLCVELDLRHVQQLQRVLATDFIRLPKDTIETEATVRFRTILNQPFFEDPRPPAEFITTSAVSRNDCPLHRGDVVFSTNDHVLGEIAAVLVHDDHVHAMVVRSSVDASRKYVIVPTDLIGELGAGTVILDIDRHEFRKLASTSIAAESTPARHGRQRLTQDAARRVRDVRTLLAGDDRSGTLAGRVPIRSRLNLRATTIRPTWMPQR